jgi:hypothetical protein
MEPSTARLQKVILIAYNSLYGNHVPLLSRLGYIPCDVCTGDGKVGKVEVLLQDQ